MHPTKSPTTTEPSHYPSTAPTYDVYDCDLCPEMDFGVYKDVRCYCVKYNETEYAMYELRSKCSLGSPHI